VVSCGFGGQALGGSPFEVFVGGDAVALSAAPGVKLAAFGADFLYAPSFDTIPADTYRIAVVDGAAALAYEAHRWEREAPLPRFDTICRQQPACSS
jgi:hypothetical protein